MGVLTDIVIAHAADAEEVLAAAVPSETFAGFDAKGLDQVKLATLNALLLGTDFEPGWLDSMTLLGGDEEEGPWLFQIPGELVARLAALSDIELARIAKAWAATDELADWAADDVKRLLDELRRCSRQAADEKKDLLMWTSL